MCTDADLFKRTVCFSFSSIWQRKSCSSYGLGDYHPGQRGRYDLFISFPAFHGGWGGGRALEGAAGGEDEECGGRGQGKARFISRWECWDKGGSHSREWTSTMRAIHQLLQQHSSEMERARNYSFSSIPGVPGVPARKQLHTDSCTFLGSNISYCNCIWLWGSQRGFFSSLQFLVHQQESTFSISFIISLWVSCTAARATE